MGNTQPMAREDRFQLYEESINHWGASAQEDMLVEECAELIVAMNKYRRKPSTETLDHLAEEMADVLFMMEEITYLRDKESGNLFSVNIMAWLDLKLLRTRKRLNESMSR